MNTPTSNMNLPQGMTCGDCAHFKSKCSWFISSLTGAETRCDWSPSRFRPKPIIGGAPEDEEPMTAEPPDKEEYEAWDRSQPKHTPGPWEYHPARNYGGFSISPKGTLPTLASVERPRGNDKVSIVDCFNFPGDTEANARLIAASPNLLAACIKAEKFIDAIMSFFGTGLEVANWHLNGDLEPLDTFIDENSDGTELVELRSAINQATNSEGA